MLNDTGDLSSGNVSLTEVMESPIPRVLGLVTAKLALDEKKVIKLKEDMEEKAKSKK